MNLFLDASVVLAACGRAAGASRAVFDMAARNGWTLMKTGFYGLGVLTPGDFLEQERAAGRLR